MEEEGNGSIWRGSHVSNVRGGEGKDRGQDQRPRSVKQVENEG